MSASSSDADPSRVPNATTVASPTPGATTFAEPLPAAGESELSAGRYVADAPFRVPLVITVPDGWQTNAIDVGSVSLVKRHDTERNAAFASFFFVDSVYADPCAGGTPDESAAADAETLVEALRAQPGFDIGELTEGTLDGHATWTWEIVPSVDISTCADDPWLYQVRIPTGAEESIDGGTVADAIQRFTVIDLDGTPLIAEVGTFTWTRDDDLLEAVQIIESARFAER